MLLEKQQLEISVVVAQLVGLHLTFHLSICRPQQNKRVRCMRMQSTLAHREVILT